MKMKIIMMLLLAFNVNLSFSLDLVENSFNSKEDLKLIQNDFIEFSKINASSIEAIISTDFKNIVLIKLYAEKLSPRESVYHKYLVKEKALIDGEILFRGAYGLKTFDDQLLKDRNLLYLKKYFEKQPDNMTTNVSIDNISDTEQTIIYIFTDTSCGYCRKYYEEIPALNKAGVSVKHIPYPRSYNPFADYDKQVPAFSHISNTLCVKDDGKLLSEYFNKTAINPEIDEPLLKTCKDTTVKGFFLGQNVGITGTPGTLFADGSFVSGYIKAPQVIKLLKGKKLIK